MVFDKAWGDIFRVAIRKVSQFAAFSVLFCCDLVIFVFRAHLYVGQRLNIHDVVHNLSEPVVG